MHDAPSQVAKNKATFIQANKVRVADLDIYLSNVFDSPNPNRHDKHIVHTNIKNFSKVTQFVYFNSDICVPSLDHDNDSDNSNKVKTNTIYMSIESKMGCHIRVFVEA